MVLKMPTPENVDSDTYVHTSNMASTTRDISMSTLTIYEGGEEEANPKLVIATDWCIN